MKHFVTLFPAAENVHLVKDVGQIPYQMHRHYGYKSTLVCYKNSSAYPYQNKEVKGLNIEFIENKGSTFFGEKGALQYLRKNARSIDVLNLYHLTQASLLYGIIFKLLNPGGILYLKLDFNINRYKKEGFRFSETPVKEKVHQLLFKLFIRKADILSVETREAEQLLKKTNDRFSDLLLYVPNGVDESQINNYRTNESGPQQKENLILTVGRIGQPEKNHNVLLKALADANLQDWEAIFVGPIRESFQPNIDQFYKKNPDLKKKIRFTGLVSDREKLFAYYQRAKVFCLPSQSEGFPLALIEALSFGNYIVGTDAITSIKEVTDNGQFGRIVPAGNAEALSEALEKVTADNFYDDSMKNDIIEHSKRYHWKSILTELNQRIDKIRENR
jgi:glycosyltransferase involved in cell wall biosynthesis